MKRPALKAPIPRDVQESTPLTRSVAQGIYSSLDPRHSELYFAEALVFVEISYDPRRPTGKIIVNPERVTIKHTTDPFAADSAAPAQEQKPRQVRWVIRGLAETDKVVIRPKPEAPEHLFNFLGGSVLEVPAPDNSITSGLPFIPHFEAMATEKNLIVWRYGVEVWRGDKKLFEKDPEIHVEGEYNTTP
ncbi:MAG: hypothetical protein HC897_13990 [Thermoanaerobaculia bacterium]|nr:hypothetical protein [Thermoanaerobaculia bacterium]